MNIKKIFILALAICMILAVFVFVSCDNEKTTQVPEPSNTEAPTKDNTEQPTNPGEIPTTPAKKANYIVSVEDFDGEVVSGITIEIYNGTEMICSGETNSNGKFIAELEISQSYTAKISKAMGYLFDEKEVAFDKNGRVAFTVNKAVEYSITVTDAFDDAAIENVTVEFYTRNGNLAATGITDSDGVARIWAEDIYYKVSLTNVPAGYENEDTYILNSGTYELAVSLFNPDAFVFDGRDAEHPLMIYHGDKFTVGAGAKLYCRAPGTSGCVLKIENADSIKVEYNGVEYTAEEGIISVQFELQTDADGNVIEISRSLPNAFVITNASGSAYTGKVSMLSPDDHVGTEKNPFDIELGVETTTPEFIVGTSMTDPGVSTYYYQWVASENGFFWIDTFDAIITVYINGSIVINEKYESIAYALVCADDEIRIQVESMEWLSSASVRFTADFDAGVTEIPDRFTCDHVYDNGCDTICNICGNIRLPKHTEMIIPAVEPTCTEVGRREGIKCAICDEIIKEQEEIAPLGHTEQKINGMAPTCTQNGLTDGSVCTVCEQTVIEQKVLLATGHSWSSVYKYDDECHWQICEAGCGETTARTTHEITQSGNCICGFGCSHDEVEWSIEKETSCSEAGKEIATCKICGTVVDSRAIEKLEHTPGSEATCTSPQTCTVCDAVIVAAKGHVAGDAATCTTPRTCTVCGEELTPALGHTPGAAATCTTDQICLRCDVVLKEAAHTPGPRPTCYSSQKCTVCNEILAPMLEHKAGGEATCTEGQTCVNCGIQMSEPLGHKYNSNNICTVCGAKAPAYIYKITVVNAFDKCVMPGIKVNFYDPTTNDLVASIRTDDNGYAEYISATLKNANVIAEELSDEYSAEAFFLGQDSYFGFEYTMQLMNQNDYIYDGRDELHPLNVGMGDGKVTVAANSTLYCMYPRAAGLTMKITGADGIKVVYNGVEYTATNGVITVKFDIQRDENGSILSADESRPSNFAIVNTTSSSVTVTTTVA